jgi:hypothetical protein
MTSFALLFGGTGFGEFVEKAEADILWLSW